jgi:hypothetical protein
MKKFPPAHSQISIAVEKKLFKKIKKIFKLLEEGNTLDGFKPHQKNTVDTRVIIVCFLW